MGRSVLEGFAAKIRANVRKVPDGAIDVAAQRAQFDAMGRIPHIALGTQFERHALPEEPGRGALLFERVVPEIHDAGRGVLYFHGGAFSLGTLEGYRSMVSHIATACRAPVELPEYRLAPEHPFPAAPDDALRAWRAFGSKSWVMMGDSAGANLAMATMVRARDEGLPLPAAAVLISPWVDLDHTGASLRTNAELDPLIREGDSRAYAALYAKGVSTRDPRVSPLYADLHGLPPIYIQVGKDESLYDDAARLADRARAAGVDVTLDAFDGVFHVWHFFAGIAPESDDAIGRIGKFVRARYSKDHLT